MPSLRVRDATESLADLTNHPIDQCTPVLFDTGKILQSCDGPDDDFRFDAVDHSENYVEVSNENDHPGSVSRSTPSRLSSDATDDTEDPKAHSSEIISYERRRDNKRNAKSGIWQFFEIYRDRKFQNLAFCLLCKKDVNYSTTMSTGMLTRHVRTKHRSDYQAMLEADMAKKFRADTASDLGSDVKVQSCIDKFVEFNSSFEAKLTHWIVQTYQPLTACENPFFRDMCQSLNMKAPNIGVYKIKSLLSKETACIRVKLRSILQGPDVSITTDAWTSCNNVTYITCTAHFVSRHSWMLYHFPLGLFKKSGTSLAEDVVRTVEGILLSYNIDYSNITCIVTDTEATMVKAARIFASNAERAASQVSWHGCIDHLLNLITKIAFKDFTESDGAMNAARELVGFFSSSSQAEAILLSKQIPGSEVKCIQDVATRWWSTYSMCERLLRLRPYFSLMEAEGQLKKNLTNAQWMVVKDTTALLEPFMCAQRLLEGECYVTISMIAFIVWKIRRGLLAAIESPESSQHVNHLARKMNSRFEEQWGCGDPGTVATEHLTEGPRRRPKGIPRLALVASLVDPRFKFGPGFSDVDKNYIWNIIRQMMTHIAVGEQQREEEPLLEERRQQQQPRRAGLVDAMFLELNQMAMEEQAANGEDDNNNNNNNDHEDVVNRVDAELLLYKREPHLPLKKDDGSFNNPLDWWRLKEQQYPLIATIARRVLAIPATSAPSERVFSVAGITIAKERSRLDPENAGELIFLHDTTPAIKRYESGR